jgi:hypothetical protein
MMDRAKLFQYILGSLVVVGFFALLILLIMSAVPESNMDLLNLVVGALIGTFSSVVNYYFGSSAGSAAKEKTISDIATKTNNGNG